LCKINGKEIKFDNRYTYIYYLTFKIYSIFFKACLAFAYDELAYFTSHDLLDKDLVIWINKKLASPFPDFFILEDDDVSDYIKEAYHLPRILIEPWMKIDVRKIPFFNCIFY